MSILKGTILKVNIISKHNLKCLAFTTVGAEKDICGTDDITMGVQLTPQFFSLNIFS